MREAKMPKMNESPTTPKKAARKRVAKLPDVNIPDADNANDSTQSSKAAEKKVHWLTAIETDDKDLIRKSIGQEIEDMMMEHGLNDYMPLFLYDNTDSIGNFDLDKLYAAASVNANSKNILLILHSPGGSIEPAYLISKALKFFAKDKFIAIVPRRAKSAATLICLGADEIHMGVTSQLGPIDPQIGGFPALGLINALDVLASLTKKFPEASKMLSDYLQSKLDLRILGYFNRVTESAVQYGERLLKGKNLPKGKDAHFIADHLVNHYKDHSFVIDIDEAQAVLGSNIVKVNTKEYQFANDVYEFLDFLKFVLSKKSKDFYFIGDAEGISIFSTAKT